MSTAQNHPPKRSLSAATLGAVMLGALSAMGFNVGGEKPAEGSPSPEGNESLGILLNGTELSGSASAPVESPETKAAIESMKAQLAQADARTEALQKDLADQKKATQLEKDTNWINTQKAAFKITPTQGDTLLELAKSNPVALEAVKPTIEANVPPAQIVGNGNGNGETVPAEDLTAGGADADALGVRLEKLAADYQKANSCTYADAFSAVCTENPDLARQYRAAQTEKSRK